MDEDEKEYFEQRKQAPHKKTDSWQPARQGSEITEATMRNQQS